MRTHVRQLRGEPGQGPLKEEPERGDALELVRADDEGDLLDEDGREAARVRCPGCARPIALLTDEDELPQHALCPPRGIRSG